VLKQTVSVGSVKKFELKNPRKRIGKRPSISHAVENIDDLMYVSNQVNDQRSRKAPGYSFGRKHAVASLQTPDVGDENPTSLLASPDDDGDVAEPHLPPSFEDSYRGPGRVKTYLQSRKWRSDARGRGLRRSVGSHGRNERPIYQDLIEVVSQEQGCGLGGKHAVAHIRGPTDW
jgi:hypothetical protein